MLTIEHEETGTGALILHLRGEATVEHIGTLQQELTHQLQQRSQVLLNCEELTRVDIYAVQLLCAAHRSSIAWNSLLTWHGKLPEVLREVMIEAGFARKYGCSLCPDGVFCMWSHEPAPA